MKTKERPAADIISPELQKLQEEHLQKLIREGKVKVRGKGVIDPSFLKLPRAKAKGNVSVVEEFLKDRRTGR